MTIIVFIVIGIIAISHLLHCLNSITIYCIIISRHKSRHYRNCNSNRPLHYPSTMDFNVNGMSVRRKRIPRQISSNMSSKTISLTHPRNIINVYGLVRTVTLNNPSLIVGHVCNICCPSAEALSSHLETEHLGSGKGSYTCQWEHCTRCQKPFTQRQKAIRHIRTHTGLKAYKVISFQSKLILVRHLL